MKNFKEGFDKAKSLTIFIYAYHKTFGLMSKYMTKQDTVRPDVIRFVYSFLTL